MIYLSGVESLYDRSRAYRRILSEYENLDVPVVFVSPYARGKYLGVQSVQGEALWRKGGYLITLADNMPIETEVRVFSHEASHVLLGQVLKRELTHKELVHAAGQILDRSPAVDVREDPADALASRLLAKWYSLGLRIT